MKAAELVNNTEEVYYQLGRLFIILADFEPVILESAANDNEVVL